MSSFRRYFGRLALKTLTVFCVFAATASADLTPEDVADPGPASEAYGSATWASGIDRNVVYIRPGTTFSPDDSIRISVPTPPRAESDSDLPEILILGGIIAFVLALIWFSGGGMVVSFRRTSEAELRRGTARTPLAEGRTGGDASIPAFLAELAAMPDKREALILLVSRLLDHASAINKVRLGRAATARDAVRALPKTWTHHGAVEELVREAELVHFGGRNIRAERWEECLTKGRRILSEQA